MCFILYQLTQFVLCVFRNSNGCGNFTENDILLLAIKGDVRSRHKLQGTYSSFFQYKLKETACQIRRCSSTCSFKQIYFVFIIK